MISLRNINNLKKLINMSKTPGSGLTTPIILYVSCLSIIYHLGNRDKRRLTRAKIKKWTDTGLQTEINFTKTPPTIKIENPFEKFVIIDSIKIGDKIFTPNDLGRSMKGETDFTLFDENGIHPYWKCSKEPIIQNSDIKNSEYCLKYKTYFGFDKVKCEKMGVSSVSGL